MKEKLFWLIIFGIAFAWIESSVVVYLRRIYYPEGFRFPVVLADLDVSVTELIREAATLILMYAAARLTFAGKTTRFAAFIIIFGVWDIFYYVFLKLILNWPESFFTWDILFLLPYPWVGPVWAPVLVSLGLIWAGTVVIKRNYSGNIPEFSARFWAFEIICALLIIVSFLIPGRVVLTGEVPEKYPALIFWLGYIPGLLLFASRLRNGRFGGKKNKSGEIG